MNHSFNTDMAKKYGLLEAVLLENIAHWLDKNLANNANFKEGRYWTYNSSKGFAQQFDYASAHQIRRALDSLVEKKVLIRSAFNKAGFDKTSWYTFADEFILSDDFPFGKFARHIGKTATRFGKFAKPIPDINTDINPDTPRASLADDGGEHFKNFWSAYPKKAGKDAAKKAFAKRKFDEQAFEKVMAALNEQKASEQWVKDAGQFIPHPATWLNQGRFDDELMVGGQQASSAFSGAI